MTTITIPPEAVEAAAKEDYEAYRDINEVRDLTLPWDDISDDERQAHRESVRRSIAAGLSAWPGAEWLYVSEPVLALPMPTENTDA